MSERDDAIQKGWEKAQGIGYPWGEILDAYKIERPVRQAVGIGWDLAQEEIDRIKKSLDNHLPTVIYGLWLQVEKAMGKERDDLTADEVAVRAAFSAAHWIAKDVATGGGEALYDLPSVVDLMNTYRKNRTRIEELEAERDAAVKEMHARELHHFEVEEENAALRAEIESYRARDC